MDQARLRPAQVGASTAAAVGGAFLASRLGIYGTIIGVGVITLMSTVGSEMLLRSLERTKQAAWPANPRLRPPGIAAMQSSADEADTIEQPVTAVRPDPVAELDGQRSKARRWPLVAGGFLASFGLALAVIAGIEAFTGQSLDGDGRPTVVNVFRVAGQDAGDAPSTPATPTSDESTDTPEDDGTDPQPDPATSPSQSPPPAGEDDSPQRDEGTPPPGEEETPSPDDETSPPEEDPTPPPDEEETAPVDDDPTPEP